MTWAHKRKWAYISVFSAIYFIIIGFIYFTYFYNPPNCFDGLTNGSETGVDCGGSCVRLCPRENLDPIVHWSRAFQVNDITYNLVAYIENPNLNAGAEYAPYVLRAYDTNNNVIYEKKSATFIPVGKIFGVFDGPVEFSTTTPHRVTFEFDKGGAVWDRGVRTDTILKATRIRLTRERPTPRVDAALENSSLKDIQNVEAVALIYDDSGNAFAASRTFVDVVPKEGSKNIVFTWPKAFTEQFTSCEAPADIALIIDRSGSMADDKKNPPEPLTTVKQAAETFVDAIGKNGRVAVVSFATQASIDSELSSSRESAKSALAGITIGSAGLQQTNIGAALEAAARVLKVSTSTPTGLHYAAVLLTDGVPTDPVKVGFPRYARTYAEEKAFELSSSGVDLYAIGLGKNIDEGFLQGLVSDPQKYYKAPTSTALASIYGRIAASLCKKNPVIEVIPRIYPQ